MQNNDVKYSQIILDLAIKVAKSTFKPNAELYLVIDDTSVERPNGFHCEGSTTIFDHKSHTYTRGYYSITLGITDGKRFVPIGQVLVSTSNEDKLQNTDKTVPCKPAPSHTESERTRQYLVQPKIEATID